MPGRVLVDTNVVIYLATGHRLSQLYGRYLEGNVVALSFATAAELLYTARRTKNPVRTVAYWREKLPLYVVLFPDLETCDIWARITADMKGRGQPRQDNDLWIEPALSEHLARLDAIDSDRQAAEGFFDFRVADIAMGSGHFLVAAVDRIERALSGYLARRALPDVLGELQRLRTKARQALGPMAESIEIDDTQLLRRQIARRCVYGVDLNPLSVQLARLSLWIHTFVPGLPLSFLDHNLVEGNSLVGVATTDEAQALASAPGSAASAAIVAKVQLLGLQPYRPPDPLPPIDEEDINLVCWMGVSNST